MRWFKLFPNDEHQWRLFGIRDKAIPKDAVDADFDSFLTDAPADDKQYARKNNAWAEVQEGESSFDALSGRPKYNGADMTHSTNIPEVKTAEWDAAEQNAKTYADGKFLPLSGGTVVGDLTVGGAFYANGVVKGNAASLFGGDGSITSGEDLNSDKYKVPGTWRIGSNSIAATLLHCPSTIGGSLIVRDANAGAISITDTYCYRHQIYIPYTMETDGFYVRAIHSHGTSGAWTYDDWSFFSAVDGIKSEGTSGDWCYRTWSSGKKELWYKKTVSITTPTQRGQLWISGENVVNYPSGFTFDNFVFCVPNADAYGSATHPSHMFNVHASSDSIKYRVDCTVSTTLSLTVTFYIFGW